MLPMLLDSFVTYVPGCSALHVKMIISAIKQRIPSFFPAIPGKPSDDATREARDYSPEQLTIPHKRKRHAPQNDVCCDRNKAKPKRPHG